jgi:hypothetical protein
VANHTPDMNRDPISGAPGSHPVGTGVGAAGGATAGALAGAIFGPIGMLVGGSVGAVAGGLAGKGVAERMDPTAENEYWRENSSTRPYYNRDYDYDNDYSPAYAWGANARTQFGSRDWDDSLEGDLREGWSKNRGESRLDWDNAKHAVRDSWDRSDRTYRTYEQTDRQYENRFDKADYYDVNEGASFDDYRPAYRYGAYAKGHHGDRQWDESLENDLGRDWDRHRGGSKLSWERAKHAVKDAWHGIERKTPGDADRDGR